MEGDWVEDPKKGQEVKEQEPAVGGQVQPLQQEAGTEGEANRTEGTEANRHGRRSQQEAGTEVQTADRTQHRNWFVCEQLSEP